MMERAAALVARAFTARGFSYKQRTAGCKCLCYAGAVTPLLGWRDRES